ncbi:MAG: Nramp family divalent metal transporter [Pirellulales bacterium]
MNDDPQQAAARPGLGNSDIQTPPQTVGGILRRLGPGLIIAASIVGSGELIATTKTGAEAGFTLLWLILLGCVVKVFAQIEIGRYTITEGRTAIEGLNQLPGPRLRVNWLVWYWVFMFCCGIGQLGGIVGVVGQSLAIPMPFTSDWNHLIQQQREYDERVTDFAATLRNAEPQLDDRALKARVVEELGARPDQQSHYTYDDAYWSGIVTVITAVMLVLGRYRLVQNVSVVLVAGFTLVSIVNLFALQWHPNWRIGWDDIVDGLRMQLPPASGDRTPVATALAAFGIIGVGASELIYYPYWCLEKGYARWTGPCEQTESWAQRAHGWLRVMRWDAVCSLIVYTFATLAFYLTGAAVLHRANRIPSDEQLVPALLEMYVPVFNQAAEWILLFGVFTVLYSTFFVSTASNSRAASDAIRVYRLGGSTDKDARWRTRVLCALLPFISLTIYVVNKNPVTLVLISGMSQAVMLPMLGAAALYFRYQRCDRRIMPTRLWDVMLWLSFLALLTTGIWGVTSQGLKMYNRFAPLEAVEAP